MPPQSQQVLQLQTVGHPAFNQMQTAIDPYYHPAEISLNFDWYFLALGQVLPALRDIEGAVLAARKTSLHPITGQLLEVYPPPEKVWRSAQFFPLVNTKVVILGQDPYPGPGEGNGL